MLPGAPLSAMEVDPAVYLNPIWICVYLFVSGSFFVGACGLVQQLKQEGRKRINSDRTEAEPNCRLTYPPSSPPPIFEGDIHHDGQRKWNLPDPGATWQEAQWILPQQAGCPVCRPDHVARLQLCLCAL